MHQTKVPKETLLIKTIYETQPNLKNAMKHVQNIAAHCKKLKVGASLLPGCKRPKALSKKSVTNYCSKQVFFIDIICKVFMNVM